MIAEGTRLGRYEIRSKIGEGGMGEVYLAQDAKLDRKVALKILPAEVAADRSRMNRFVQEAKAASALNHPNIITIYEIDEADSGHFIATEFIDGETLRDRLRKGPMTASVALDIAAQIAAALAAAHQAGIIHRDIKPENVMVRADGLVKVLDFGLAKLTAVNASDPDAATKIHADTQPGMIMGTVAYMSPEQARGQTVDPRTDVWSLGVVLYEMLSRRTPFRGETGTDTLANILHRDPEALNIGALPDDLAKIIDRMLAKKLEARYATVADVVSDLKTLQRRIEFDGELQQTVLRTSAEAHTEIIGAATAPKRSSETRADSTSSRTDEGFWIAVLPFKYSGANPDLEALAEGLSEDIVTGLSRFPFLRVLARNSTSRFASDSADIRATGREVGARYEMEGSLRYAGAMLRVTVQLLDAETGAHMWAETYKRELKESDLFAVQDEIADRIVATVADGYGVLVSSMAASLEEKPETELTACDWLLRQCRYRQLLTPEEHARMRDGLERFVEREPKHAEPWACLAQLYVDEFVFKFNQRPDALDRALVAARRSVDLNRTFQYGHQILAQVHFFRRDVAAFRTAADKAMSLNSRDTDTLAMMGLMLVHIAEFERGANIVRRAMDLNPNHAGWYHFALIWHHLSNGDYEKALARITRVNMPGLFWQPLTVASLCGLLERPVEAAAAVQELRRLDPNFEEHVREYIEVWHYSSGLMDRILEGLSKAGVEIVSNPHSPSSSPASISSGETPMLEGFWVAVLPFKSNATSSEIASLAEALSEEIITGLSRFSYLRVIGRGSTLSYSNESRDVRTIGKELGARYVMEGSIRQAGTMLRVTVQLVDTSTGAHLWAETYNRPFQTEDIFSLQDELVPCIVSTVADWYGALPHSMGEAVHLKPPDRLSPYEAVLRSFAYYERVTPENHAAVRSGLERAVEQAPGYADGWAMLSVIYGDEHRFGFNVEPDALGRSLKAAQRAVDAASSNHYAYLALAQALFFRKEFSAFRGAAERAIALNPMDGAVVEYMAHLIAFSGDWKRGCELAERARQLNPNHPGWYWSVQFYNAYRQGDYDGARAITEKVTSGMGEFIWQVMLAALYGQLGDRELADKAVRELLTLQPDFALVGRKELEKWYPPALVEQLIDGFRKAGLEIASDTGAASTSSSLNVLSSESRADEGFWVAVLPFKSTSSDPAITELAEGLSEDIITGLSRFSYLRVIARSSTLRYANESGDVRAIGNALGARYVMEGSLRQAGKKMRLAVQLVDATNGAQLWAETYERTFDPESVFDLQDQLVPPIVSTVADLHGVLPRSMGEAVRCKPVEQLTPYEAVLRSFRYSERVTPEVLKDARSALEVAVQNAPAYADAWAMLATLYTQDYGQGFNLISDSLAKGEVAGRKAVELAPSNHLAWFGLAGVHFFQRESQSFRHDVERAVALNPMDGNSLAHLGELLTFSGEFERGLELTQRAKELNPHHPGWYWYANFYQAFSQNDYRAALGFARKVNLPGHWAEPMMTAAASGQLGEREAATKAVGDLLKLRPNVGSTVRRDMEKWWSAEAVEHLIDGLRKAGLKVAEENDHTELSVQAGRSANQDSTPSIAVLPFANLSNDPDNDYFCDGLAEELLNGLSKIDELKVAARTSAFSFKGKNANVGEIAAALNVNTVLEGSVRKSGDRVRITTQLVNAADGYHLWSERYDREMKDIFDVQDEITLAVIDSLQVELLGKEKTAVLKRHTNNPQAHEFYLRGLAYFVRFTPEFFQKAIESFEQAIAIDPNYASAYAGLAESYTEMTFFSSPEWMTKAREAAQKALELDDTLGNAHNSLAIIKMYYERDYAGAEHEFKRAIALDSGNAHIHMWYAWYLGLMGRFDDALKQEAFAQELDPLSDLVAFGIGAIFHWSRQPDRAIQHYRRRLELNPNLRIAYWFLAEAYVEKGDFASAIDTIENAPQGLRDQVMLSASGFVYAKAGERQHALEILSGLEKQSVQDANVAFNIAQIYLGLGEHEQALTWLEKAYDERSVWLIWLGVDPKFDPLRANARFQDLLRQVGLSKK